MHHRIHNHCCTGAAGFLLMGLIFGFVAVWLALPVRYLQAMSIKD